LQIGRVIVMGSIAKRFLRDAAEAALVALPVFFAALGRETLSRRAVLAAVTSFGAAFVAALRHKIEQ
jgi:hypothetical protein